MHKDQIVAVSDRRSRVFGWPRSNGDGVGFQVLTHAAGGRRAAEDCCMRRGCHIVITLLLQARVRLAVHFGSAVAPVSGIKQAHCDNDMPQRRTGLTPRCRPVRSAHCPAQNPAPIATLTLPKRQQQPHGHTRSHRRDHIIARGRPGQLPQTRPRLPGVSCMWPLRSRRLHHWQQQQDRTYVSQALLASGQGLPL